MLADLAFMYFFTIQDIDDFFPTAISLLKTCKNRELDVRNPTHLIVSAHQNQVRNQSSCYGFTVL